MRFLFFLLIGSLIFGLKFPAYVLLFGFLTVLFFFATMFILLRKGTGFKIYTNRSFNNRYTDMYRDFMRGRNHSERNYGETTIDMDIPIEPQEPDIFEEEGEIIELPSTALRREG